MPRQCQFPIQFSDNRRCYRSGTTPGFVFTLAVVAALTGYAGLSHAASSIPKHVATAQTCASETTACHSPAPAPRSVHPAGR